MKSIEISSLTLQSFLLPQCFKASTFLPHSNIYKHTNHQQSRTIKFNFSFTYAWYFFFVRPFCCYQCIQRLTISTRFQNRKEDSRVKKREKGAGNLFSKLGLRAKNCSLQFKTLSSNVYFIDSTQESTRVSFTKIWKSVQLCFFRLFRGSLAFANTYIIIMVGKLNKKLVRLKISYKKIRRRQTKEGDN